MFALRETIKKISLIMSDMNLLSSLFEMMRMLFSQKIRTLPENTAHMVMEI